MKIALHLGTHKTASTHLQAVLDNGSEVIKAHRCRSVPMQVFRSNFTEKLFPVARDPDHAKRWLEKLINETALTFDRVILSDENLLGEPRHIFTAITAYPDTFDRLSVLRPLLGDHDIEVFLSLRSFSDFVPSIYCEALWWDRYKPFSETYGQRWFSLSWIDVVRAIREALQPKNIFIWPYTDYPGNCDSIIAQLTKIDSVSIGTLPHLRARASFSHKTVRLYESLQPLLVESAWRQALTRIDQALPSSATERKFAPFSAEAAKQLDDQFVFEMTKLSSHQDVTLI